MGVTSDRCRHAPHCLGCVPYNDTGGTVTFSDNNIMHTLHNNRTYLCSGAVYQ